MHHQVSPSLNFTATHEPAGFGKPPATLRFVTPSCRAAQGWLASGTATGEVCEAEEGAQVVEGPLAAQYVVSCVAAGTRVLRAAQQLDRVMFTLLASSQHPHPNLASPEHQVRLPAPPAPRHLVRRRCKPPYGRGFESLPAGVRLTTLKE